MSGRPGAPSGLKIARALGLLAIPPGAALFGQLTDFKLCWTRYLDFSCPGCGLGRATWALLHGDLQASLQFHPLVIPTLLLAAWVFAWSGLRLLELPLADRVDPRHRIPAPLWITIGLIYVGTWVVRYLGLFGLPPLPI